jgi:hypothetical protein
MPRLPGIGRGTVPLLVSVDPHIIRSRRRRTLFFYRMRRSLWDDDVGFVRHHSLGSLRGSHANRCKQGAQQYFLHDCLPRCIRGKRMAVLMHGMKARADRETGPLSDARKSSRRSWQGGRRFLHWLHLDRWRKVLGNVARRGRHRIAWGSGCRLDGVRQGFLGRTAGGPAALGVTFPFFFFAAFSIPLPTACPTSFRRTPLRVAFLQPYELP